MYNKTRYTVSQKRNKEEKGMKKTLVSVLLCLMLLATSTGLAEELTIGYTVQNMQNAYFVSVVESMKAAAKERGIDLIVADAGGDAVKHVNHIEDFIAQDVDAIIISPVDQEAPADAVKAAKEAGIAVVSLDQEVSGSDAYYGADDYDLGYMAGTIAGNWLNGKLDDGTIEDVLNSEGAIEVVIVRYDIIKSVIRRGDALKDSLLATYKGDHEIRFVYEQNAASADEGFNLAETALTANPEIALFLCINDSSALGVYEACLLRKEHTPDNTCIVGVDSLPEALKLISENTMFKGTVSNSPDTKGDETLDIVMQVLENGPIEGRIPFKLKGVDASNIAEYITD